MSEHDYRRIVEAFVQAVNDRYVNGKGLTGNDLDREIGPLADLYRTASGLVEEYSVAPPAMFISVGPEGIRDVSSEDALAIGLEVFVIDETCSDKQGISADIDATDGTIYPAHVKKMVVTPLHFDPDQVREIAGEDVYANGAKI